MALADAFVELGVDQGRLETTLRDSLVRATSQAQATASRAGQNLSDAIGQGLKDPFAQLPFLADLAGGKAAGSIRGSADTMGRDLAAVARPGIFDGLLSAAADVAGGMVNILGNAARSVADVISSTLSTSFKAAGVALGVLGTAIVNTGVSYNSLVQRSLVAFTTVLGTADLAKQMLTDITDFARQSPFPRQIFIASAQELLGFGVSAEKILPTFQAIQDAVAATGGTGEDIANIAHVLAQANATGRITGELLQQLALRGINAAQIIGNALGRTPEDIKQALSEGSIDFQTAMDALVNGMETRFAGGAALVKQQFVGAVDRIKGAFRDISSALLTPFIDPFGGGAAVVWANQLADMIRFLEKTVIPALAAPLKVVADHIGAWVTKAKEFVLTITTGGVGDFFARLKDFLPILAAAGAGFVGLATGALQSIPILGEFLPAINPVFAALTAFALATPAVRNALGDLFESMKPVISGLAAELAPVLHTVMDLFAQAGPVIVNALSGLVQSFAPVLADILSSLAELAGPIVTALLPVITQIGSLFEELGPVISAFFDQLGKDEVVLAITRVFQALGPILGGISEIFFRLAPLMVPIVQILGNIATAGADFLAGLLNGLSAAFGSLAGALTSLQPLFSAFARVTAELAPVLGEVGRILGDAFATALSMVLDALVPIVPILAGAFSDVIRALAPVLPELATALGQIAISFAKLLVAALPIIPPLVQLAVLFIEKIGAPALIVLAQAVAHIADAMAYLAPIMVPLVVAFLGLKTVMLGFVAVNFVIGVINGIGAALGLLNAVILANPVVAIIAGIVALGAAVYIAYQNFEPFRNVVDAVGRFLRDVFFATIEKGTEIFDRFKVPILILVSPLGALYLVFKNLGTIVDVLLGVFRTGAGIIGRWLAPIIDTGRLLKDLFTDPLGTLKTLPGRIGEIVGDCVGAFLALPRELLKIPATLVGLGADFVTSVGPGLLKAGGDLMASLLNGIVEGVRAVWQWYYDLPGNIVNLLIGIETWLLQAGKDLLTGMWQGLVDYLPTLGQFFIDLPANIVTFIIAADTWLVQTGINILTGLYNGIIEGAKAVWDWLVGLPGTIAGYFLTAVNWLETAGQAILKGLYNGIIDGGAAVLLWFIGLPGMLFDFFKDADQWLIETGVKLVKGIVAGIDSTGSAIASALLAKIPVVGGALSGEGIPSPSDIGASIIDPGGFFHAKGGIFTKATFGVFGEKGPEVLIPLNDPRRAVELASASGLIGTITKAFAPQSGTPFSAALSDPLRPMIDLLNARTARLVAAGHTDSFTTSGLRALALSGGFSNTSAYRDLLAQAQARRQGSTGPAGPAVIKNYRLEFPTLPADATLTPARVGTVLRRIEALEGG